jgi:tight adherence protein C
LFLGPVTGVGIAGLWYAAHPRWAGRRDRRRQAEQRHHEQPDVLDLFVALVRAGLSPMQAVAWMAERGPPAWRPGFAAAENARLGGDRFCDALEPLRLAVGAPAGALVDALTSADRYGHALAPALERLSDDARTVRRQLSDASARRLPVKLSFPLVCCTLPSFVLLTIAPLLGGALQTLRLGGPP